MTNSRDPWDDSASPDPGANFTYANPITSEAHGNDEYEVAPPLAGSMRPWWSVWVRPRETYRYVWAHVPASTVVTVAMIGGIFSALDRAATRSAGDGMPLGALLVICVLVGPLSGLLMLYLSSWLVGITGRWIGGTGNSERVRHALGWAQAMVVTLGVFWVPNILIFGPDMFTSEMPTLDQTPQLLWVFMGIALLEVIGGVWLMVCGFKMIGEAHRFSAWKALGASLIAGLLMLLPIIFIAGLIIAMTS